MRSIKNASLTSVLDGDSTLVRMGANTNEIIIPKISMDGLADYSRNGGYVSGDVTLTNETVTFNYDRGRKFTVDAMDNEETAGLAFGRLASEFIRTKVVPRWTRSDSPLMQAQPAYQGIYRRDAVLWYGRTDCACKCHQQNG